VQHVTLSFGRDRDRMRRRYTAGRAVSPFLVCFYPLLGFLPGRLKLYLSERVGLHPERSSTASMLFGVLAGACSFGLRPLLFRVPELRPYLDQITVAGLILMDAIFRYNKRLAEDPYPYGFLEWAFRRKLAAGC